MAYLYKVASMDDFDDYLKIKSDPAAILWSGFSSAPDPMKLRVHFQYLLDNCFSKGDVLFYLKDSENHNIMGYDLMSKIDNETIESSGHSILSRYQGRGLGTLLFKLLVEYARGCGFKNFVGWISENNIGAIKNVERNGFVRTKESCIVHLAAFNRDDVFYKYLCKL